MHVQHVPAMLHARSAQLTQPRHAACKLESSQPQGMRAQPALAMPAYAHCCAFCPRHACLRPLLRVRRPRAEDGPEVLLGAVHQGAGQAGGARPPGGHQPIAVERRGAGGAAAGVARVG
eukprot:365640-Chlamydomonas_euryale.AAC.9